jgi:hypothetical protein
MPVSKGRKERVAIPVTRFRAPVGRSIGCSAEMDLQRGMPRR